MQIIVDPKDSWVGTHQTGDWLYLVAEGDRTYRLVAGHPDRRPDEYIPLSPLLARPELRAEDAKELQKIVTEHVEKDPEIVDGTYSGGDVPGIDLLGELVPVTWDPDTWLQNESVDELITDLAHHLIQCAESDDVRLRGGIAAVSDVLRDRFLEELPRGTTIYDNS